MTTVLAVRRARVTLNAFLIFLPMMLICGNAAAQYVSVSPSTLSFNVSQWGTQTKLLTVTNASDWTVALRLTDDDYSNEFGYYPFYSVEPGATIDIDVSYSNSTERTSASALLVIQATAEGQFQEYKEVNLTATISVDCSGTVATAVGGGTVTIGAVALLKGTGGANCSWEPTTDLTDPLSCTTFAAPAATTTYTLTVTNTSGTCSASDDVTVKVVDLSSPPNGSVLPSGSILLLMRSTPAPDGYSYLGTSTISYGNGKSKTTIQVDVYSKD